MSLHKTTFFFQNSSKFVNIRICKFFKKIFKLHFLMYNAFCNAPVCNSVGIAIDYGLDGPGSNPGGVDIFRICTDRPWDPLSLL